MIVSREGLGDLLRAWLSEPEVAEAGDEYGGPELAPVTIACPQAPAQQPDCSGTFGVGLSLIVAGVADDASRPGGRPASVLVFEPRENGYSFARLVTGIVSSNPELVAGGPHFLPIDDTAAGVAFYYPVATATHALDGLPGWWLAKRTGVPGVDDAIDAALSGDGDRLGSLVGYFEVGCVTESDGLGSPPHCPEGTAEGAQVEVWTSSDCVGHYYQSRDLIDEAVAILVAQPRRTFAAWRREATTPAGLRSALRRSDRRGLGRSHRANAPPGRVGAPDRRELRLRAGSRWPARVPRTVGLRAPTAALTQHPAAALAPRPTAPRGPRAPG